MLLRVLRVTGWSGGNWPRMKWFQLDQWMRFSRGVIDSRCLRLSNASSCFPRVHSSWASFLVAYWCNWLWESCCLIGARAAMLSTSATWASCTSTENIPFSVSRKYSPNVVWNSPSSSSSVPGERRTTNPRKSTKRSRIWLSLEGPPSRWLASHSRAIGNIGPAPETASILKIGRSCLHQKEFLCLAPTFSKTFNKTRS